MKKKLFIFTSTIILIAIICTACFAGCMTSPKDIDNFLEKLQKADSMEMIMTMDIPMVGVVSNTIKVDGDKSYTSEFMDSPAIFTEVVDDQLNVYTNYGGSWDKQTYPIEDEDDIVSETESFEAFFDSEDYTYSKEDKAFKLNEGKSIYFEGMRFENVLLKLKLNSCKITSKIYMEGVYVDCTIEIKNINRVKLSREAIVG